MITDSQSVSHQNIYMILKQFLGHVGGWVWEIIDHKQWKPESKKISNTHNSHGINARNSKLKKGASCFDFTELSKALHVAQDNSACACTESHNINASSSDHANADNQNGSASNYDLSKLSEAMHVIEDKNRQEAQALDRSRSLRYRGYLHRLFVGCTVPLRCQPTQ